MRGAPHSAHFRCLSAAAEAQPKRFNLQTHFSWSDREGWDSVLEVSQRIISFKKEKPHFSCLQKVLVEEMIAFIKSETHNHAGWDSKKAFLILIHNSLGQGRVKLNHAGALCVQILEHLGEKKSDLVEN